MTQKQSQTIEAALKRAAKEGIRIIGRGHMTADNSPFWLVSSKDYATTNRAYIVTIAGNELHCSCQASGICKHRAVVHAELKQQAERKEAAQQPIPDAAKWALIEQVMPDHYAEMQQAAQEATAMLGEMVKKLDSMHLDENLWGDGDTDAPAPKVLSCSNCRKQPADPAIRGQLCGACHETLTAQMKARQEAKRRESALLNDHLGFDPRTGFALTAEGKVA